MNIPQEVKNILDKLQAAGFEAYAVGGCVRDLLLGRKPKDWDVATNALPEQIQQVFPESFYENKFGTVSVKAASEKNIKGCHPEEHGDEGSKKDSSLRSRSAQNDKNSESASCDIEFVEVTTYRVDEKYTDKRHPDSVRFTPNLLEDLARRDFTINAMALRLPLTTLGTNALKQAPEIIDPFDGQKDLEKGLIRAVGEADKRFNEDALRLLRAIRFSVELVPQGSVKQSFTIEPKTQEAIKKNSASLKAIAKERVRDEFVKIIMSDKPDEGILLLQELGLLQYIIPELVKGVGVAQNKHHIYSIFEHGIFSLKFAVHPVKLSGTEFNGARKKYNLVVRLAALLHDVAKPQAKRGEGEEATFYNHDIMGARAAARILEQLRFDNETIERVANLIRHHMFVYDVGVVTPAAVRRLLARVGPENIDDLIALRVADRLGSGVPKAQPYRLRHFQYMVDRVQKDPISVKALKINGNDLMEILKTKPGPKIGAILDVLLAEVIEDPKKNTPEYLSGRSKELDESNLAQLRQMAKARIEEEKEEEDKVIKGRYWVQ